MKAPARAALILRALKKLFPRVGIVLKFGSPWELVVAVILSAQCTDKKVNEVTEKLFRKYRTFGSYLCASASRRTVREFEQDIYQTGFYRAKAKNILAAAKMIKKKFGGTIPRTMAEMVTIPGVGRKTANVVLGNVYGVVEGIAVDTHVLRLARVLGLSRHRDPVKVERDLMAFFPKKEWFRLTYLLIEYGRQYCPARHHHHAECPLAAFHVYNKKQ
ncbi:MAG: endonuclease III [Candidatus Jorgensenbacteria bacterium]|nr:endonuclease III [Candidatus Jorgensenbacteria bacterium]